MPTAGDAPGWQSDPERPGMLRWWNGLGWSDARRTPDEVTERARRAAAEASRVSTVTPQQVAATARQAERTIQQRLASATRAVNTTAQRGPTASPPRVPTPAPSLPDGTGTRRRGGSAGSAGSAGVVLGILGLFAGVYGIISALGFLVSLQSLARSRSLAQRGAARTGLIPSLIGLVLSGAGLLIRLPELIAFVERIGGQLTS